MGDLTPVRIPLIESLESRDATTFYDAKAVNCVTESTPRGELRARKRPGLSLNSQGKVGVGQGVANYQNHLYSISGDYLNALSGGSTSFVATQAAASSSFSKRLGPMVIGFNGYLYVMGGLDATSTALNDVWRSADGVNWTQVTAAAPWAARAKGQAIVFQNKLLVMGGSQGASGTHFSDVWSTPDGINWTQASANAWPARRRFGATVTNNLLWISGGAGQNAANLVYPNTKYSDVWYTSDGVHWTQAVSNAPWIARSDHAMYSIGSTLYVCGGLLIDAFANATSDLWSSPDGVVWTRQSANPFGVATSGVWPIAALNSMGADFTIPSPITVSGGNGINAAAWAFTDFDDDGIGDDMNDGPYVEVTFSNVGSGYTTPPATAFGTNIGFNAGAYSVLNGAANGGSKACRTVTGPDGTVYVLELEATGTYNHILWSTTNGTTFTNTNCNFTAGWTPRDGELFLYGNIWFTSGFDGTNYYNDFWYISFGATSFALNPTLPNLFYHFNQTPATITSPLLVFKSTADLYHFNAALGTLTKDTAVANYPATTVPGLVNLDTYFFVMDPKGQIWGSSSNDPTTWTALNVIVMQNEPNGGVALAKLANYVVAFGQWTIEFFYDGGVAPPASPLLPQTSLPFDVGCAAGESVREMQGNIIWIGQTKVEGQGVYMFQNYTPVRISNSFIDQIIQSDPLTNISVWNMDAAGHSLYGIQLKTINKTLVYSFDSKQWDIWTSSSAKSSVVVQSLASDPYGLVTATSMGHGLSDGDAVLIQGASNTAYNGLWNAMVIDSNTFQYLLPAAAGANAGTAILTGYTESAFNIVASTQILDQDYLQDPLSGAIYNQGVGVNNVSDLTNPINVRIVTERYDGGTSEWKYCRRISLLGDIVGGNAMIAYSDNDYQSYSAFRTVALNTGQRATIAPGGRFRRRAFQIRHTAFTPFRVMFLELELIRGDF